MSNARILVADDDSAVLQTMTWLLKEHGYDVDAVSEGMLVLPSMEASLPDLVLLDVMLPDADGYQLLERIKSDDRFRDIPVLMVSSLPPEEAAVRTLGLGAADFIRKPFRVKELLARMQAQLRMRAILLSASETLKKTEEQLTRVREEAENRRLLVDILHDVTDELSTDEMYHLLARRVARALELTHCSVIVARDDGPARVVATAFEDAPARDFVLNLDRYPEVREALRTGRNVLVEDVQTDPLYAHARDQWARDGMTVTTRSVIALPFALEPTQAGVFFLRRSMNEPPLTAEDVEFADTVIKAAVSADQRRKLLETTIMENRRLEVLAQTDPLTEVLNRRALTDKLSAELERGRRYEKSVSLLLIDLDYFKRINDTHGHLVGDDVLQEVAGLLQKAVRAVDVVARYGGEEFVIVLPETGLHGATVFADRTRELIAAHQFNEARGAPVHLTTSIGVSIFPAPGVETVDDFFASADQALYRAKAEGRNRVRS
ncbi:MAG: diguanylate cyclase [Gemmatimonadaceae bacterium]